MLNRGPWLGRARDIGTAAGRRGVRDGFLVLLSIGALTACATTPPGTIIFGSPASPETTFRLDEQKVIGWTAFLAEPVEETSVNLVISPSGSDRELFGYRQFITYPESTKLVNEMPLGRFLREPGVYVMRYVTAEGRIVAEGEFELIADSS